MRELGPIQVDDLIVEVKDCEAHLGLLKGLLVEQALKYGLLDGTDKVLHGKTGRVRLSADGGIHLETDRLPTVRKVQTHSGHLSSSISRY